MQRNWVPRREDNNPKTIDQIHKDIRQEDLVRAAQLQATNLQPKQQGRRPSNQGKICKLHFDYGEGGGEF